MDKLPIYTEIFGIPHTIEWVDSEKDVNPDGREFLWGAIFHDKRKINVFSGLSDRDKLRTLFEEILHGVLEGLERDDLSGDHKFISPFVNGLFTALEKAGMLKE